MKKKYSKTQLYSGMQGKVERRAQRAYERRLDVYEKKVIAFDKYLKDLEKRSKAAKKMIKIVGKAPRRPLRMKVRKLRRGIGGKK